jgi:hypothetical protein
MKLPICYPKDQFPNHQFHFKNWTEKSKAIPLESQVVILEEEETSFRVFVTECKLLFTIPKSQCEIIGEHPLKDWGFE